LTPEFTGLASHFQGSNSYFGCYRLALCSCVLWKDWRLTMASSLAFWKPGQLPFSNLCLSLLVVDQTIKDLMAPVSLARRQKHGSPSRQKRTAISFSRPSLVQMTRMRIRIFVLNITRKGPATKQWPYERAIFLMFTLYLCMYIYIYIYIYIYNSWKGEAGCL
jgi:hypothetical protein